MKIWVKIEKSNLGLTFSGTNLAWLRSRKRDFGKICQEKRKIQKLLNEGRWKRRWRKRWLLPFVAEYNQINVSVFDERCSRIRMYEWRRKELLKKDIFVYIFAIDNLMWCVSSSGGSHLEWWFHVSRGGHIFLVPFHCFNFRILLLVLH